MAGYFGDLPDEVLMALPEPAPRPRPPAAQAPAGGAASASSLGAPPAPPPARPPEVRAEALGPDVAEVAVTSVSRNQAVRLKAALRPFAAGAEAPEESNCGASVAFRVALGELAEVLRRCRNVLDDQACVKRVVPMNTLQRLRRHDQGLATPAEVEARLAHMPRFVRERLRPFQLDGVRFALARSGRCMLADDMGCGKSVQAIAVASCYLGQPGSSPLLVVAPASLRFMWADQIERWRPDLRPAEVHVVCGGGDACAFNSGRCPRVVVTSYHMVQREASRFHSVRWGAVICDESHKLKAWTIDGKKESFPDVERLVKNAPVRLMLTGTPSTSKPFDSYRQAEAVCPGVYGSRHVFAREYCKLQWYPNSNTPGWHQSMSGAAHMRELNALCTCTFLLRRLRPDVLHDLPPLERQVVLLDKKVRQTRGGGGGGGSSAGTAATASNAGGASALSGREGERDPEDEDEDEDDEDMDSEEDKVSMSAYRAVGLWKLDSVCEHIREVVLPCERKLVIYAHHKTMIDGIQAGALQPGTGTGRGAWPGCNFARIDGSTPVLERKDIVDRFKLDPSLQVLLVSVTAGAEGLDFTAANVVIFAELPMDSKTLFQAEARIHRQGQERKCLTVYLVAKHSTDLDIWHRLSRQTNKVKSFHDGVRHTHGIETAKVLEHVHQSQPAEAAQAADATPSAPAGGSGAPRDADAVVADGSDGSGSEGGGSDDDDDDDDEARNVCFLLSANTRRMHLHHAADGSEPAGCNFLPEDLGDRSSSKLPALVRESDAVYRLAMRTADEFAALTSMDKGRIWASGKPVRPPLLERLDELKLAEQPPDASTSRIGVADAVGKELPEEATMRDVEVTTGVRGAKPFKKSLPFGADGVQLCLICRERMEVAPQPPGTVAMFSTLFCSERCHGEYKQKCTLGGLRDAVRRRDRAVCALCKLDCARLCSELRVIKKRSARRARLLRLAPRFGEQGRKTLLDRLVARPTEGRAWECDHVTPVWNGGGQCDTRNAQTLCVRCHADKTRVEAKDRTKKKRAAKAAAEAVAKAPKLDKMTMAIRKLVEENDDGDFSEEDRDTFRPG